MRLCLIAGFAGLALTGLAPGFAAPAAAQSVLNPLHYPQPETGEDFHAVIEIPAGSAIKYEIDAETGHVFVDRFLSMPVAYPANYGSVPSSAGGDGDPLDVLVLTRAAIAPGALIRVRAIGALSMIDDGEEDHKIIAVPASDIDPDYDAVRTITDLPQMEQRRIEQFFQVYKLLPDPAGAGAITLDGYLSAEDAAGLVQAAIAAHRARAGGRE